MREILLLATIILSGLAPNSGVLNEFTKKLKLEPQATVQKTIVSDQPRIIKKPTKTSIEDYTATAKAVYSIDMTSNAVLTSKDTDAKLPIASLTKLMTAYVVMKEETNLERTLTASDLSPQPGDSTMGLVNGDSITVRSLLKGLLITSGSDAAQTLAKGNSGNVSAFVVKMNTAATDLKLTSTHFTNPVGWDEPQNYSSAKDITELARVLLGNKTFAEIVNTKNTTVTTTAGKIIHLETTNQLLHTPNYVGVKTGFTYAAGECLVSLYKEDKTEILTTVIGSSNRFGETDSIKGWILDHFSW